MNTMKFLLPIITIFLFSNSNAASMDDFVITVNTGINDDGSSQFSIYTNPSYQYNFNVDCNNDGINEAENQTTDFTCQYESFGGPGIYTIRIKDNVGDGTGFPHFCFCAETISEYASIKNAIKIISLDQWGTGQWKSMQRAFRNALNMVILATDKPNLTQTTDLTEMFLLANLADPNVKFWNVSSITDMSSMFAFAKSANPDVSNWDVSSVIDMSWMFAWSNANPDVSKWDVSSVTNMDAMFWKAQSANPDVSKWDVSSVTDMSLMFAHTNADPDVSDWDVSSVKSMYAMFEEAEYAAPDVTNWDVSSVNYMTGMFYGTDSTNLDVSKWDVSSVTNMGFMFAHTNADPDVSDWDVSSVTGMGEMFSGAESANPDVSDWDVSSVNSMFRMFSDAESATPNITNWQISNTVNMREMFTGIALPPRLYDQVLMSFRHQSLQSDVTFGAGNSYYCQAAIARNIIRNTYNWDITDSGFNCGSDVAIEFGSHDVNAELNQLKLYTKNIGYQDESHIAVATEFSDNFSNLSWVCEVSEGSATCPENNGTGDLIEFLDLRVGDELMFTFQFEINGSGGGLDAIASITLNTPTDDIYTRNNQDNINLVISSNHSGSWYDPDTPGHGIFLERLDENTNQNDRLNMYWFTHHESEPVWMGGVGAIIENEPVIIDLHITDGTDFPPHFNANEVDLNEWGQVTLDFETPHSMRMDWSADASEYGTGSINLTRLSEVSDSSKGCFSGSFYDPDQSGHGLFIHITNNNGQDQINVAWFVYHEGQQFWLVGSGILNNDNHSLVTLNQLSGASFFDPTAIDGWTLNQDDLISSEWGTLSLSYIDPNNMTVEYLPNDTNQFESGEINMTRLTEIKGHKCQ